MAQARHLLVATTNRHKIEEFREILGDEEFRLVGPADLGISVEVEETGSSFEENAILKAIAYADASGMLTLADDSGLEIDALGGEPGIYSARWAGPNVSYPERFTLLEQRLAGVAETERTARYRCAIALAEPAPRGLFDVVSGTLEGHIAHEPRGTGGFGYDPIFYVPEAARTVGEMTAAAKHRISHRARATAAAKVSLRRLAQR